MKKLLLIISIISLLTTGFFSAKTDQAVQIPVTGFVKEYSTPAPENLSTLPTFVSEVATTGDPDQVAGIFLTGLLELPVEQQPSNDAGYVSRNPETATQFRMVNKYGSVALLAHNDLAGQKFFDLKNDQILSLVFGNGKVEYFRITNILEYQALSPKSPYSSFIDLADPDGKVISVTDLFYSVYAQANRLILQTCIAAEGEASWGRLFIIAVPVEPFPSGAIM